MNVKTILFVFVSFCCCHSAIAAAQNKSERGQDAANLFSGPLKMMGQPDSVPGEDISSPFIEAHSVEQDAYARLYYKLYHGTYYPFPDKSPLRGKLPSPVDTQGHPLWFDRNGALSLQSLVTDLYRENKIDDVDRLLRDWSNSSERLADGRWKLVLFENALMQQFNNVTDWSRAYEPIKNWKREYPKSPAIAFIDAAYWIRYAWNARGYGFSNTVTQEGWQLFHERLKKAEGILFDAQSYAASNPMWGRMYLSIGNSLGWPKEKILAFFSNEAAKHVEFEPIYFRTAAYLVPRWGGSWQLVDAFAKEAVKMTASFDGRSMYAYIYWGLALDAQGHFDLFKDTRANWSDLKRGFKDLIKLYPHSAMNLNSYAAAACAANDKETYQAVRFKIGKLVIPSAWLPNYSADMCNHKFAAEAL